MLLHYEVGRQRDQEGCWEWHFAAMIFSEWQIENCAGGDGLEKT
jgi:hypothetical protein